MWELRTAQPFGNFSIRNILTFAAAMIVACFAYIFISAPAAHAADADWQGDAIVYQGDQYTELPKEKMKGISDLPQDVESAYIYIEPNTSGTSNPTQKAHLIYFSSTTDPTQATYAKYLTLNFNPPDKFSNPSDQKTLSITKRGTGSSGGTTTSCDSTFTFGIGWIVCPVTNFLASAMDWLFEILSNFLVVRPAQTGQTDALYRAWSFMRNFANIAFVIGFIIIIYSQITNVGISNYGIKRTLPRLIIAAILVNVSYWVCAIAIDLSNILGYSVQDIFIGLRNGLLGTDGNSWDVLSWKSVGGFILSGGTAITAAGIGTYALLAGTVGGALYLLLPILVGVLMAVLVALLVMAARQAIITVLVIIAPLAFVAYLLPNTEKYFDKWRGLFMTMLMMFPIFSVIFGGSQLAGIAIIQNADSINLIILGMAVQVAPVVVTPLLVRFSGSLLGKIAGMVNNPNRGIIDRTRKYANERAGQHKARVLADPNRRFGKTARYSDSRRRMREGWKGANEAAADANWANSTEYSNIQQSSLGSALHKERGETLAQARFEAKKHSEAAIQQLDLDAKAAKLKLDVSKAKVDANWEELKAGDTSNTIVPVNLAATALTNFMNARTALAQQAQSDSQESLVEARRQTSAHHVGQHDYTDAMEHNQAMRDRAGGIDPNGAQRALAYALTEQHKARGETISNANAIIEHSNLNAADTLQIALNNSVKGITVTDDLREAAIKRVASNGVIDHINTLLTSSTQDWSENGNEYFRTALVEGLRSNGNRPKYIGQGTMDKLTQGISGGIDDTVIDSWVQDMLEKRKLSASEFAKQDEDTLKRVAQALSRPAGRPSTEALANLRAQIAEARSDKDLRNAMGERVTQVDEIERNI